MNVAFIQSPAWLTYAPPVGIAILADRIKKEGHTVKCYDLNIDLFNISKKTSNTGLLNRYLWDTPKIQDFWCESPNVEKIFVEQISFVEAFINELILFKPGMICFSVQNCSFFFSSLLTKKLKRHFPSILIVWGGPYCFKTYGNLKAIIETLPEVDIICTGDGEKDFQSLITNIEKHGECPLVPGYFIRSRGHKTVNDIYGDALSLISDIPFADFSLFKKESYSWEFIPILVSRGCVNRCAFCNECHMHEKYSFRNPQSIVAEIEYQKTMNPQIKDIWFACSNIGCDLNELTKLCNSIVSSSLSTNWVSLISVNKQLTPSLFKLMKESGCLSLCYGIESGSNKVLKLMKKGYNKTLAGQILKRTTQAGIRFNINIVVGFPGENIIDFIETLFFIHKFYPHGITPSIGICAIIHNSPVYNFPEKYNILNHKSQNWITSDGKNTFKIREAKKTAVEFVYKSKMLNIFNISRRMFSFSRYVLENHPADKFKLFQEKLSYSLYLLFHVLSYIPFLFWIVFLFIKLKILEISEKRNFRKKNIENQIMFLEKNIISKMNNYLLANSDTLNPDIDAEHLLKRFGYILARISDSYDKIKILNGALETPVDQLIKKLLLISDEEIEDLLNGNI